MVTEVIPLGTASAIPTRDRHLSGLVLRREGMVLLFDCGEGTQYQLMRAGVKRSRIDAIFITHFHGDHCYGLMGLLSTMSLLNRTNPLTMVGPTGLAEVVYALPGMEKGGLSYPIDFCELPAGFEHAVVLEMPEYYVEARPIEHRTFTIGYRFQERTRLGNLDPDRARELGVMDYAHFRALKRGEEVVLDDGRVVHPGEVLGPTRRGVAFAYVSDTIPCENGIALGRDADLMYHEATYGEEHQALAVERGHSTAKEAAEVALKAGAQKLLISHFSARYPDDTVLVQEARQVFQNTDAAEELKRYVLNSGSMN